MTPSPFLAEALRAARETHALEIGENILDRAPEMFREQFGDQPAVIVTDPNTFTVAGEKVAAAFRQAGRAMLEPFIFRAPDLYAEERFVAELETALRSHAAVPVAIGSGTINDLTKLAAHRTGRSYLCVATAASMDGYTAFGASITADGLKQTFFCPAPAAVLADLKIICGAPGDMNSWGYADLLAKVTAGADWILADALGVEPIDAQAWSIVQSRLREMIADPAGVKARDPAAIRHLVEGLMLGGFAMQATKSSRSASGAEHQFSHLWDMQHHTHRGQAPSHGFKVGIGSLASTALYEQLLAQPLDRLDVESCCAAWPEESVWPQRAEKLLGKGELLEGAIRELRAKHSSVEQLRAQLEKLRATWPGLREKLRAQLLPLATLKKMLGDAGAPTEPEEIGITRERLRESYAQAFCIRRRFTVLDFAVRAGRLECSLDQIFGPNGLWPVKKTLPAVP
ncbi:MAG: sn-glycerol-1-phosphate dehydrogenase [Verrucomicrobiota bacterium]